MMKKLWNYNGVRLVLVFILTTVLVYESAYLYLMNGGMFWLAILSFGLYLLFFLLPFSGIFIVQKKVALKIWAYIYISFDFNTYCDDSFIYRSLYLLR